MTDQEIADSLVKAISDLRKEWIEEEFCSEEDFTFRVKVETYYKDDDDFGSGAEWWNK